MSAFVVDAAVAVKWFVPEVHSESAARLLANDHDLHVPDLLFPEFGNTLWKKVRRGELTANEATAIVLALSAVPLEVHSSGPLLEAALELALATARTVYDSLYIVLGMTIECPLVTADERLYNALSSTPFAAHLMLLTEMTA